MTRSMDTQGTAQVVQPSALRIVLNRFVHSPALMSLALIVFAACTIAGCGAIETRKPEPPSYSSTRRGLVQARPVTTHVAEDTDCDVSPDGTRMVFVSNRSGNEDIWLQDLSASRVEPARALTEHPAPDTSPRISPDGKRIAFVSARDDAHGDIWLLELNDGELHRLTDRRTVDSDPCWTPDGKAIVFAATEDEFRPPDIWKKRLEKGVAAERLTEGGGFSPAVSPDGQYVAYVSQGRDGAGQLRVLRLSDKREAPLLTGRGMSAQPRWSADGQFVYFARYYDDTDGDGTLTAQDNPAIWRIAFDPAVLGGGAAKTPQQLTSSRVYSVFPVASGGRLFFTSRIGDTFDVWELPCSGELPVAESTVDHVVLVKRLRDAVPQDRFALLLACRETVRRFGGPNASPQESMAGASAICLTGRTFARMGNAVQAAETFQSLLSNPSYSTRTELVGLAEFELARLAVGKALKTHDEAARSAALADPVKQLGALVKAKPAGGGSDLSSYCLLTPVPTGATAGALAALELGRIEEASGRMPEAMKRYDQVVGAFPGEKDICARAILEKAELYALLQDHDAVVTTCVKVLQEYPEQAAIARQAAADALNALMPAMPEPTPEAVQQAATQLYEYVERYRDVPVLPAAIHNRIGDVFYSIGEIEKARTEYRKVIERFAKEGESVVRAQLSLARIAYEQEDYEKVLFIYRSISELHSAEGDDLYHKARQAYIQRSVEKAMRELDTGDVKLARKTFERLLNMDETVVEAHRGIVDCDALLDKAGVSTGGRASWLEQAEAYYRAMKESKPADPIPYFCLARILSYRGPGDWIGRSGPSTRRAEIDRQAVRLAVYAVDRDARVPYYHQLLGFLYERLGMATGETRYYERAAECYITALALSDYETNPRNYADLLFNVGEVFKRMKEMPRAYSNYMRAFSLGLRMGSAERTAVVLDHTTDAAIGVEDYPTAKEMLLKLLGVLEESLQGGHMPRRDYVVRRAIALDRLALVCQQRGEHKEALGYLEEYCGLLQELVEGAGDSDLRLQYRRNWVRARRNMGISLFNIATAAAEPDPTSLARALEAFEECIENVKELGVRKSGAGGSSALISVQIEQGLGPEASLAARGFDDRGELRLLYTYVARTYEVAGDAEKAITYLRRKMELYEVPASGMTRTIILGEKSVIWNQIAGYHLSLGQWREAAEAFRAAFDLDKETGNLHGQAVNAVNLGQLAVDLLQEGNGAAAFGGQTQFDDWTGVVSQLLVDALAAVQTDPKYAHPEYEVYMRETLSALSPFVPVPLWIEGSTGRKAARAPAR